MYALCGGVLARRFGDPSARRIGCATTRLRIDPLVRRRAPPYEIRRRGWGGGLCEEPIRVRQLESGLGRLQPQSVIMITLATV